MKEEILGCLTKKLWLHHLYTMESNKCNKKEMKGTILGRLTKNYDNLIFIQWKVTSGSKGG